MHMHILSMCSMCVCLCRLAACVLGSLSSSSIHLCILFCFSCCCVVLTGSVPLDATFQGTGPSQEGFRLTPYSSRQEQTAAAAAASTLTATSTYMRRRCILIHGSRAGSSRPAFPHMAPAHLRKEKRKEEGRRRTWQAGILSKHLYLISSALPCTPCTHGAGRFCFLHAWHRHVPLNNINSLGREEASMEQGQGQGVGNG